MLGNAALSELPLSTQPTAASGDVTGSLSATEGADTFAGSGVLGYSGSLAATEAADTFAGTGVLAYSGSLAATEGADTFSGSGSVIDPITGTLAATEAADTFAGIGSIVVTQPATAGGNGGLWRIYQDILARDLAKPSKRAERRRKAKKPPAVADVALVEELPQERPLEALQSDLTAERGRIDVLVENITALEARAQARARAEAEEIEKQRIRRKRNNEAALLLLAA